MDTAINIILNPVAGSGKGAAIIEPLTRHLERNWPGHYQILQTKKIGDAIQLAGEISNHSTDLLAVVGGDGTINEVVNGLLQNNKAAAPAHQFGIINCGSGGGFAQSLGIAAELETELKIIAAKKSCPVDVGVLHYTNMAGNRQQRFFISECQIGIGGATVSRVGLKQKRFGGKIAFASAAVAEIFHYTATQIKIKVDDQEPVTKKLLGVVIGNGRYTGGGMQLTPTAKINDGFLDVLTIGEMSVINRLITFSQVYSGNHVKTPFFTLQQAHEIQIESDAPVWVAADGELLGHTPCSISIKPSAISVFSTS